MIKSLHEMTDEDKRVLKYILSLAFYTGSVVMLCVIAMHFIISNKIKPKPEPMVNARTITEQGMLVYNHKAFFVIEFKQYELDVKNIRIAIQALQADVGKINHALYNEEGEVSEWGIFKRYVEHLLRSHLSAEDRKLLEELLKKERR